MNWQHIKTIWQKEILDTIRDRRTLLAGVLAPIVLMPLFSFGSMYLATSTQKKAVETRTNIAVYGEAEAPKLMEMLRASNAFTEVKVDDPIKALKDNRIELALRIPAGFEQTAMNGSKPAELTVEYEAKKMTASVAVGKLRQVVDGYMTMAQITRPNRSAPYSPSRRYGIHSAAGR